jgi:hypothetical protein
MSERTWTQSEVDAIVKEDQNLEGLTTEEVAAGKARIEAKYGLSPGMLSKPNVSTAEGERQQIYRPHFEATQEEVDAMDMEQFKRWRNLGSHQKKSPEEVQHDAETEARAQAQAEENALIAKMSVEEYKAYKEEKALKAQQKEEAQQAEVTRLVQEEQRRALKDLGYKRPEDMTMAEYATWRKSK